MGMLFRPCPPKTDCLNAPQFWSNGFMSLFARMTTTCSSTIPHGWWLGEFITCHWNQGQLMCPKHIRRRLRAKTLPWKRCTRWLYLKKTLGQIGALLKSFVFSTTSRWLCRLGRGSTWCSTWIATYSNVAWRYLPFTFIFMWWEYQAFVFCFLISSRVYGNWKFEVWIHVLYLLILIRFVLCFCFMCSCVYDHCYRWSLNTYLVSININTICFASHMSGCLCPLMLMQFDNCCMPININIYKTCVVFCPHSFHWFLFLDACV